MEIWKEIKDYEGKYEVSNTGNVRSILGKNIKILKQDKKKYCEIGLHKDKKRKKFLVHRLVAYAFIGDPEHDKMVINHKDGNKINNNAKNLEWISQSENRKHAKNTKLFVPKTLKVTQYTNDKSTVIANFASIKEAMKKTGCSDTKISLVCKGKRNHTGGFFWKYTDFDYEVTEIPDGKEFEKYSNYIITSDGKVYSKSHKKFISTRNNNGYLYVSLYNGTKKDKKDFSIHFLVAKTHLENPNNYPVVNHKNLDKTCNNVENLEWVTYSENSIHYVNSKKSLI